MRAAIPCPLVGFSFLPYFTCHLAKHFDRCQDIKIIHVGGKAAEGNGRQQRGTMGRKGTPLQVPTQMGHPKATISDPWQPRSSHICSRPGLLIFLRNNWIVDDGKFIRNKKLNADSGKVVQNSNSKDASQRQKLALQNLTGPHCTWHFVGERGLQLTLAWYKQKSF